MSDDECELVREILAVQIARAKMLTAGLPNVADGLGLVVERLRAQRSLLRVANGLEP